MMLGLESAELPADAIEVGRIADAWGVKGWFKVLPYSASPEALFSSKRWFLQPATQGAKTFSGTLQFKVIEAKDHSGSVVAHGQDVTDRNQAELLKGARIFVARSSFPTPEADEYYWVDLLGLEVVNREGEEMGHVRELLHTGPQTVLVLEFVADDKTQERMIPFVSAYIDNVDLAGRRITVDWHTDY
jgi:16S rRNA processing protein RimM